MYANRTRVDGGLAFITGGGSCGAGARVVISGKDEAGLQSGTETLTRAGYDTRYGLLDVTQFEACSEICS